MLGDLLGGGLGGMLGQAAAGSALGAQQSATQQQLNAQYIQSQAQAAHFHRGQHVDKKHEEELRLRKENPGVKEAWEMYQIMLKLASTE